MDQSQDKNTVLIIYPATFKFPGLHIGIASLSSGLKEKGYQVKVFDTVFYDLLGEQDWNKLRSDRLMSKKIVNEDEHWKVKTTDMKEDLIKVLDEYQPKIVGISMTEPVYDLGLQLSRIVKQHCKDAIVIAGGVFPTLSPDIVIKEDSIDVVCVGEGEMTLPELCDRIYQKKYFTDIPGMWVKNSGKIYKNSPAKLQDINNLPHPDFSVFDEPIFYKAMQGRLYKMVNIETSRGCPYNCSYCASPELKSFSFKNDIGSYYRNLDMERVIEQLHYQIGKHSPEFIYFSSETFLAMSKKDFDMFVEEYRKIKIPFWFQTRFETITEERIKALKEVGMFWLTLGIEHGNEDFRKKILKRGCTTNSIIEGANILSKLNVGASLNNMMGFPFENRELIFETIKLNKKLFEMNNKFESNIFMFVPYRGTELYEICRKNGLLPQEDYSAAHTLNSLSDESTLNFTEEYKRELKGLLKTFNLYIKLPEKYWPEIKIAERSDEEGSSAFNRLSQLL
ncbi:MAG: radical SAM protein [bacterium]|nr:radical SAM protein [bacterium]